MDAVRRTWKRLRLAGLVALTLAAAGGPSLTVGCTEDATGRSPAPSQDRGGAIEGLAAECPVAFEHWS